MNWTFNGLPLHPLLVHAVVVLLPLAGLLVLVHALWPAARRRLGWITPAVALAAVVSTALAKQAGEALEQQVAETGLLEAHTRLGDRLLPWAVGVLLVALVVWAWFAFAAPRLTLSKKAGVASVAALAIVSAAVVVPAGVLVFQVGESGAASVWADSSGEQASDASADQAQTMPPQDQQGGADGDSDAD